MTPIKIEGPTYKYSEKEQAIVAIMRLNAAEPKREVRIKRRIGKLSIEYHWRSKKSLWGRFGGGWNWKLGVNFGSTVVILELLIFTLRFDWKNP